MSPQYEKLLLHLRSEKNICCVCYNLQRGIPEHGHEVATAHWQEASDPPIAAVRPYQDR
jgi:hypothetical protein